MLYIIIVITGTYAVQSNKNVLSVTVEQTSTSAFVRRGELHCTSANNAIFYQYRR